MAQNEAEANAARASRRMLAQLDSLRRTPLGAVIYDQIAHIVEEQEGVQSRVAHTYAALLDLLLETYACEPTADHVVRVNARLIQLRHGSCAPPLTEEEVSAEAIAQQIRKVAASRRAPGPTAESPNQRTPPVPAPEPKETEIGVETPETVSPQIEHRINTAYRLHLDRKRVEIEKLQAALTKSVAEAVTQNHGFGALLQIELRALQQAEGAKEVENLRQILIGGIEELIHGQTSLDAKLHRTGSYLKLIKDDSERLHDELDKVRLLSLTDEFTGLPNRRAFMRQLQDEIGRSQRYGSPLALAMIDLDGFKAINDEHGHAAGDAILRCYATQVLTVLRHYDLVARYGGEEFAVLLPNTTGEGAVAAINKVRHRMQETRCDHDETILPLPTFSTGVTLYVPGESHVNLVDRADRALYRAKRLGRNRVEIELPIPAADVSLPARTDGDGVEA